MIGLVLLAVSMMYTTIVGKDDANASVMIVPDADHVNTSICPGVSKMAYLKKASSHYCKSLKEN